MDIVARFLWSHHQVEKGQSGTNSNYSAHPNESQKETLPKDSTWMRLFAAKQRQPDWVPTLSAIVKAGDEGVYSSTLFNNLHGHPDDIHLEVMYNAFANELRTRPSTERSSYPSEISRFLSSKRARRTPSFRETRDGRPELSPKAPRASLDLAERGLSRARSKKTSPVLVSASNVLVTESGGPAHGLWTRDLTHALWFDGRAGLAVTSKELAALSVILGSQVTFDSEGSDSNENVNSKGAFGISVSGSKINNGDYRISLRQHKRRTTQLPARGSGYSTLYAKHLASGSLPLPFSPDSTTVNAILIANETLEAIQRGSHLQLQATDASTPSSTFLANIPHSKTPTFHMLTSSPEQSSTSVLLTSISELPFTGGLPPLASSPLIKTVQFVTAGGLVPGRLLQRLEALVDKVHGHSPSLKLFGPLLEDSNAASLFRERERLGKVAGGGNNDEALANKVARMQRYITLLERLMCLVPGMKPQDVHAAAREATKKEIERSYEEAVTAYANKDDTSLISRANSNRNPMDTFRETRRSKTSSSSGSAPNLQPVSPTSTLPGSPAGTCASPRPSSTFPVYNLGSQMECVLKGSLPFDVETIALVARLVIVAWTLSVETVAWEEGEKGFRALDLKGMPEKMVLW